MNPTKTVIFTTIMKNAESRSIVRIKVFRMKGNWYVILISGLFPDRASMLQTELSITHTVSNVKEK